jgi:hypothetical protein
LSIGVIVIAAIAGIMIVWFAVGMRLNIRKGDAVLRWLHDGLPRAGERTTLQWLGSSVMKLTIEHPKHPFEHVELSAVFEPRDTLLLWALARVRGRRDSLIFRARLLHHPLSDLEAFTRHGWSTRGVARALQIKGWTEAATLPPSIPSHISVQLPATADAHQLKELFDDGILRPTELLHLSVRREEKLFSIEYPLRSITSGVSSKEYIDRLIRLARLLTGQAMSG